LQLQLQNESLGDDQDLNGYVNNVYDINTKLSWVGQGMSPSWLRNIIVHALSKSRYKTQLKTYLVAHSAAGTSISSVDQLIQFLSANDILEGKALGGAGNTKKSTDVTTLATKTKTTKNAHASAVSGGSDDTSTEFTYHSKHPWIGAMNLGQMRLVTQKLHHGRQTSSKRFYEEDRRRTQT